MSKIQYPSFEYRPVKLEKLVKELEVKIGTSPHIKGKEITSEQLRRQLSD